MKCPNCDKKLTNERIKRAKARQGTDGGREAHKIYCNNSCFEQFRSEGAKKRKTCGECGEVKSYAPHPNSYGVRRCAHCSKIAVSRLRLDSEIKELVVLNPGAGFDYFIDTVFGRNGGGVRWIIRPKLTIFLQDLGEIEGVDYIGWLQNPDVMRIVKQKEVPVELERYIRGQRRSSVSTHVQSNKIKLGKMKAEDARFNTFVKIPPEFRWGKYKPL